MNVPIYILKVTIGLAVFLGFYRLILEKQSFHHFKRFYLLFCLCLSLAAPFIHYTEYKSIEHSLVLESETVQLTSVDTINNEVKKSFDFMLIIQFIYLLGAFYFLLKFIYNMHCMFMKIKRNPRERLPHITKVFLKIKVVPHSFFNYLFFNHSDYKEGKIPQEVLLHEESHALQKHSLDVICIELIQILFWFHPLIYWLKNSVKMNHEFLADQAVLKQGVKPEYYKQILLNFSNEKLNLNLASPFNYSIIKKRFTVMNTKHKKRTALLSQLLVLPLVIFSIYSFSNKEVKYKIKRANTITVQEEQKETALEEFNRLAKHYSTYPKYEFVTKVKDFWRIKHLYAQLNEEEKQNAEKYPVWTTSLKITVSNEGKYFIDEKEVELSYIEGLLNQLSKEELSNAYVFWKRKDNYLQLRGKLNRQKTPPNDTYISLYSKEIVRPIPSDFKETSEEFGLKPINYVSENPKLKKYQDELLAMLRTVGAQVDY